MREGITWRLLRDGIAWHISMIPKRCTSRRIMLRMWRRMPADERLELVREWRRISPELLTFAEEVAAAGMAAHLRKVKVEVEAQEEEARRALQR